MNPLPALIQIDKPARVPTIAIGRHVDMTHPSRTLLRRLVDEHPSHCTSDELIDICGYSGNQHAALAWHVMRVNDSLPLVGWKIDVAGDRHSLIPISEAWHLKLVERYERRRRVA